ncbi:MAG: histidine kinase dimerization/phospho-acceptor domain-containing protein [Actinomycetota bacterium]
MAGVPETGPQTRAAEVRELQRAISHNLRTPLAVIKGCTDMLLAHGKEVLDDQRRQELLETTAANVDLLADAIVWLEERIDALARQGSITLPPDREPVDDPGRETKRMEPRI